MENMALISPPYSHGTRGKWFNPVMSKLVWGRETPWKTQVCLLLFPIKHVCIHPQSVNMLPYFANQTWLRILGVFWKDAIIRVFIKSMQETRVGKEVS